MADSITAGATDRGGSKAIEDYMLSILPQSCKDANSTYGLDRGDMSVEELRDMKHHTERAGKEKKKAKSHKAVKVVSNIGIGGAQGGATPSSSRGGSNNSPATAPHPADFINLDDDDYDKGVVPPPLKRQKQAPRPSNSLVVDKPYLSSAQDKALSHTCSIEDASPTTAHLPCGNSDLNSRLDMSLGGQDQLLKFISDCHNAFNSLYPGLQDNQPAFEGTDAIEPSICQGSPKDNTLEHQIPAEDASIVLENGKTYILVNFNDKAAYRTTIKANGELIWRPQDLNLVSHDVIHFGLGSQDNKRDNYLPGTKAHDERQPRSTSRIQLRHGMRYIMICLDDKTAFKGIASRNGRTTRDALDLRIALRGIKRLQFMCQGPLRMATPLAEFKLLPDTNAVADTSNQQADSHAAPKETLSMFSPVVVKQTSSPRGSEKNHKLSPPVAGARSVAEASLITQRKDSQNPPSLQSQLHPAKVQSHVPTASLPATHLSAAHHQSNAFGSITPSSSSIEHSTSETPICAMDDATYFRHHDLFGEEINESPSTDNQTKPAAASRMTGQGKKRGHEETIDPKDDAPVHYYPPLAANTRMTDPKPNNTEGPPRNKKARTGHNHDLEPALSSTQKPNTTNPTPTPSAIHTPPTASPDIWAQFAAFDKNRHEKVHQDHEIEGRWMRQRMMESGIPSLVAAARREEDPGDELHPAYCGIKLTSAEAREMSEEMGWVPLGMEYMPEY